MQQMKESDQSIQVALIDPDKKKDEESKELKMTEERNYDSNQPKLIYSAEEAFIELHEDEVKE